MPERSRRVRDLAVRYEDMLRRVRHEAALAAFAEADPEDQETIIGNYLATFDRPRFRNTELAPNFPRGWLDVAGNRSQLFAYLRNEVVGVTSVGGEYTADDAHNEVVAARTEVEPATGKGTTVGSGVRISPNLILTAAHVVERQSPSHFVWGSLRYDGPFAIAEVVEYRIPESRKTDKEKHDIAVAKIKEPIHLPATQYPMPVVEIARPEDLGAETWRMVGYGERHAEGSGNRIRNATDVCILSRSCATKKEADRYRCTRGKEIVAGDIHQTACHGDSGGGLFVHSNGWKLAGTIVGDIDPHTTCRTSTRATRVSEYLAELAPEIGSN